ncbi:MAG: GNAT family N-acetyltransferase [Clostridiales bacterium]|nr:GNAT family N-acetyltransferase [Clostridiales bacterium]
MLIVRRLTAELLERIRPISDASLCGEDVMLRIGRTGFVLGYVPLPRAEWRSFPMPVGLQPSQLLGDPSAAMFLAFDDEVFVGQAIVYTTSETRWTDVLDIRVDAAHRRKGVARALLSAIESFSRKQGMNGLRIALTDDNTVACQFCEHCGFTLQGLDRMALAYTEAERDKPLARRACELYFYQQHQKG